MGREIRRGKGKLDVDWSRIREAWARQPEGKGLIGGDPRRRPRWVHPIPEEPAPWFRLGQSSPEHRERLVRFLLEAPAEIEIGAGSGHFIADWARKHPDRHFLVFEVRWKFARKVYKKTVEKGLTNVWVSDDDARVTIPEVVPDASIHVFHILMPDPWWRPKHQARRIFSPWFIDVLARKLVPGGIVRFETDVEGYPEFVEELFAQHPAFEPHNPELEALFADAQPTLRQQWCIEHGIPIFKRYFRRKTE
ncbi:MAG: hypothetical protein GXO55_11050 [Chloroflexi bacterium]|nr:hypothetical protein [Chloroflexota bacterium]